MRASSDGGSVTVRALVGRVLTERRYGISLWASTGYLVQYSALRTTVWTAFAARRDHSPMCGRYVTPGEAAMERAYSLTAIPCGTCVREHSASTLRRVPRGAAGRAPPGHGGRPWPPPECARRGHSGQRRARVDLPRAQAAQFSEFQFSSSNCRPRWTRDDRPDFR